MSKNKKSSIFSPNAVQTWIRNAEGLTDFELQIFKKIKWNGKNVLDVGCGTGTEAAWFKKHGATVSSIDISKEMIKIAKAKVKGVNFSVGDARKLCFKQELFDIVVMPQQLISHIPQKSNRILALKEAKRVLKRNGLIVISASNVEGYVYPKIFGKDVKIDVSRGKNMLTNFFNSLNPLNPDRIPYHFYSQPELASELIKSGFSVRESSTIDGNRKIYIIGIKE